MGTGIAQIAATAGHPVFLFDTADGAVDRALSDLRSRLDRSVAKGQRTAAEADRIVDRVVGCGWLAECAPAGMIVEAVFEDLETKRLALAEIENLAAAEAIIATNTSSLSVTGIAAGMQRPERFVGMHFFNPAPVMPLVEIISGAATDPEMARRAAATVADWGKVPVHCASTPGFIVNRVARPFYGEALRLAADGVGDHATIDAVMTGSGGFAMGPFALMDLVGIDVNLAVSKSVFEQSFHDARFAPHVTQQSLVDAGHLGRKSGRGFYAYGPDAPHPAPLTLDKMPPPENVEAHGDLGWASGLVPRMLDAGIEVDVVPGGGPGHLIFAGIHLMPTDGRTATELASRQTLGTNEVVVFDLVHDWESVTHIGLAVADQAAAGAIERAAGLFQAIGCHVSRLDDAHGLAVMRTVAQLAAVGADTVGQGIASPADVDTAMKLGTNYPSGPLEWADQIGVARVAAVLSNLRAGFGEDRYRVPFYLGRRAATGQTLRDGGKND